MDSWEDITQVATGDFHTVGLKSGGTVVAVGYNDDGQCNVGLWEDITQVAAGGDHTVGLKSGGTVVAVGRNNYGQCNVSWAGITQVAAGYSHTVGLRTDSTVVTVGDNGYGQCNVDSWTGITQVAAGDYHTVGLKSDGTVVAVGDNNYGQCNVSWAGITQVAAGEAHTVGLKSGGTVVAVGYNGNDQGNVGLWTGITQVDAGKAHTVGLKRDGTVVAVGYNGYGQCNVGSWAGITQVATDGAHTVGLKRDGTVVAVGHNSYGQCNMGWNLGVMTSPTVTTNGATAIGTSSATLNMSYTLGDYTSVSVQFAYKKSSDTTWTYTSWVTDPGSPYFKTVSGLDSNTTYDFKAQLKYDSTVIEGSVLQFTTGKVLPTVTTTAVTGVTTSSATLNMSYTLGDYTSVSVQFVYKKSSNTTWTGTGWEEKTVAGIYAKEITGLSTNTQYDFKAELKYDTTTIEGSVLQFTTGKVLPTVTTTAVTGVTTSSATLNMSYTLGDYTSVSVQFVYKKSSNTTWTGTGWEEKTVAGIYAKEITGLSTNTQYDFKAQLKYNSTVIESSVLHFTTGKIFPTVTTNAATDVDTSSATLNMSYTLGDYTSVSVQFAYKKSSDTTWTETGWEEKTVAGTYGKEITGLSTNTQYDFKAELKYDSTVIEGSILQFTTGQTFTLTIYISPSGSGSVTLDPPGGTYSYGTVVTLTAIPATGWYFVGWSGDINSPDNPITFNINKNMNINALFVNSFTDTKTGSIILLDLVSSNAPRWRVTIPSKGYDTGWMPFRRYTRTNNHFWGEYADTRYHLIIDFYSSGRYHIIFDDRVTRISIKIAN